MFQSLIGFKINWNNELDKYEAKQRYVSIPNRV